MIKVINFPFCNVSSVLRYLKCRNFAYQLYTENHLFDNTDTIIIPGVGTFDEGMNYLNDNNISLHLKNHAKSGGKILGICLGMQLLLSSSDESPGTEGLSIITGSCSKLLAQDYFLVPHIGWNGVLVNESSSIASDFIAHESIKSVCEKDVYFVHSYVASTLNSDNEILYFKHPQGLKVAALRQDNVFGFQFHPEKSGPIGYQLLDEVLK